MKVGRDTSVVAGVAAVLLLGLVLRVVFWYGLVNVDPYAYADAAESVVRGLPVFDPEIAGHLYYTQYLRLSLVLPAGAIFALFGPGEWQATAFPIGCSLATSVVAFFLVLHISHDRIAALIAAFITVIFPDSVINSTQFLPDTVLAFFSALTILLFWKGLDAVERPWRQRAVFFAITGVSWALAFYSRQTAIGLALPLFALVLYKRRFDLAMLAGIPGALLVASGVSVLLMSLGGKPFEDIKTTITEGRGSQPGALGYTDLDWTYLRTFSGDEKYLPLTLLALLGVVLIGLTWRSHRSAERRQITALLIVVAGLYVYFEFFMRLPTLYSWIKEPRYALVLVVPLAAFAGIGFSACTRRLTGQKRHAALGLAATALAGMGALSINSVREDHQYWQTHRIDRLARDVATAIEDRPEPVVFAWNDDLSRYMSFYIGLERNSVYERSRGEGYLQNWFDARGFSRVTPGSLVVISPGQDHWSKPTAHAPYWNFVWSDGHGTTIWSVPLSPASAAMESMNIEVSPEVAVTGFGLSEAEVFPRQHVVLTIRSLKQGGGPAHLAISLQCPDETVPLFAFDVPTGETSTSSDIAISVSESVTSNRDCEVLAGTDGGQTAGVSTVRIGGLVRIEPEDALTYDPENTSGWYRRDYALFSSGAAIAAPPYHPLQISIPQVEGDLWIDLGVFDNGVGENVLEVTLNGVSSRITWANGPAGLVHRQVALTNVPAGNDLTVNVEAVGQPAIILDSVVIASIRPPDP